MWSNPTTFAECETALDSGRLYVQAGLGKYYPTRRNGVTKRWKRDATRYRIPIKFGFRGTFAIDAVYQLQCFRIANSREEAETPEPRFMPGIGKSEVIYSERTENGITAYVEK